MPPVVRAHCERGRRILRRRHRDSGRALPVGDRQPIPPEGHLALLRLRAERHAEGNDTAPPHQVIDIALELPAIRFVVLHRRLRVAAQLPRSGPDRAAGRSGASVRRGSHLLVPEPASARLAECAGRWPHVLPARANRSAAASGRRSEKVRTLGELNEIENGSARTPRPTNAASPKKVGRGVPAEPLEF
jgi:hypothetical protein